MDGGLRYRLLTSQFFVIVCQERAAPIQILSVKIRNRVCNVAPRVVIYLTARGHVSTGVFFIRPLLRIVPTSYKS